VTDTYTEVNDCMDDILFINKYPLILRKRVGKAVNNLRDAIETSHAPGNVFEWVKRYRSRGKRSMAHWCGTHLELIPFVEELDEAFKALHAYDPKEYVSIDEFMKIRGLAAKKGGEASAQKSRALKALTIRLYEAGGEWTSLSKARDEIWPQVKAEAVGLGRPMTDSRGPKTVYDWLREYKKSVR
jgi:hypothetical protein